MVTVLYYLASVIFFASLFNLADSQTPGYSWGGGACVTEDDCSLGGECVALKCICDNYFTGESCQYLNLQRPQFDDQAGTCHKGFSSYYSWGGHSIVGDDGKAHLIASFMCNHKDLGSWTTISSSVHMVADQFDGQYTWADVDCDASGICTPIIAPWSHNTVSGENGPGLSPRYLVAHIGDGVVDPKEWSPCFNKSDVHDVVAPTSTEYVSRLRGDPGGTCYYSIADDLNGPWLTTLNNEGVVINNTGAWAEQGLVGNPAPLFFANGSVNLYFTGRTCPPAPPGHMPWRNPTCIAVAHADSWNGTYQMYEAQLPVTYPESEDPTVFQDKRGNFHLFTNVNTGHQRCDQGVPCGGHAWSRDGYHFTDLVIGAFGPVITFLNNTQWRNAYVERPLFTMAKDRVTPLAFHVGLGRAGYLDSCNWVQLLCTDGTDPNCGPTRFAPEPPPHNVTLRNAGKCLIITNVSSFPCSGTGDAEGCPLVMGDCSDPSAQWSLDSESGFLTSAVVVSSSGAQIGLDVDCNHSAPHTLVKALASGFNAVAFSGDTISVLGGAACLNTGQGPALPLCGPSSEHWLPNQIQTASCSDASAHGWSLV